VNGDFLLCVDLVVSLFGCIALSPGPDRVCMVCETHGEPS